MEAELVVIGAGPGGYTAAFYAADLGKQVVLIDRESRLGGVCLNHGCIPSKALLHATHQIAAARESARRGIHFTPPRVELSELRAWKNSIVAKLAGGVALLGQKRGVKALVGKACFESSNRLRVSTAAGVQFVEFEHAIIATGSKPALPPMFDFGNPRIMTSTEALDLPDLPEKLLVVGGGYIGMEIGSVYAGLGSHVVIAEVLNSILTGADPELVRFVAAKAAKLFKEIRLQTLIDKVESAGNQIKVEMVVAGGGKVEELYDHVLVAVGRTPNSANLGLDKAGVVLSDKGFIKVDSLGRSDNPNVYAIGDVTGGLLLAHKAHHEARIAVDALTGRGGTRNVKLVIPAVVFTDPELAWCGLTEAEARQQGIRYEVAKFPWSASGRALSFDRTDGLTKILIDPTSECVLGVGMVGPGVGELISEAVLALNLGAKVRDIAATVHPHPTLSETFMECAEAFYGHATHVMNRKRL